jgi:hypothetical protein
MFNINFDPILTLRALKHWLLWTPEKAYEKVIVNKDEISYDMFLQEWQHVLKSSNPI